MLCLFIGFLLFKGHSDRMVFPSLNVHVELSYIVEDPNLLFLQSETNFWEALEMKDIFEDILKGIAMHKYNQKLGNEQNQKSSHKKVRMWCAVVQ